MVLWTQVTYTAAINNFSKPLVNNIFDFSWLFLKKHKKSCILNLFKIMQLYYAVYMETKGKPICLCLNAYYRCVSLMYVQHDITGEGTKPDSSVLPDISSKMQKSSLVIHLNPKSFYQKQDQNIMTHACYKTC